jgi:hypothetical protein
MERRADAPAEAAQPGTSREQQAALREADEERAAAKVAAAPAAPTAAGGAAARDRVAAAAPAATEAAARGAQRPDALVRLDDVAAERVGRADTMRAAAARAAPAPQAAVQPLDAPRIARAVVQPAADSGWTAVSEAEAARRLGGPIAVIEGLDLTGVAVREEAGTVVVRVTQQLSRAQELELIQRAIPAEQRAERARAAEGAVSRAAAPPRAAEPARPPAAAPAAVQVRQELAAAAVAWRGYSVTATGPVPAESLRVLLTKLRAR